MLSATEYGYAFGMIKPSAPRGLRLVGGGSSEMAGIRDDLPGGNFQAGEQDSAVPSVVTGVALSTRST
jgi:hypothetical protein